MQDCVTRREWIAATPLAVGLAVAPNAARSAEAREPFGYCLNTSTVRGQKRSIVDIIDMASRAGYTGLEPWLDEIERYTKSGGSLRDLGKRIRDRGLSVESSI